MSGQHLIVYPNCSKGGVTSVIRGRAAQHPEQEFHVVFFRDKGGAHAFIDLSNVHVRIVRRDRVNSYLSFILAGQHYDSAAFLSCPETFNAVEVPDRTRREYEFHSSDLSVIQKELSVLQLDHADRILAPSAHMASQLRPMLASHLQRKLTVEPNLVDTRIFRPRETQDAQSAHPGRIPLVWVGRFDKGKGFRHFLRLLRSLPQEYFGIMVASFEQGPDRAAEFLGEASYDRVDDRIQLLLNQPQSQMASIYQDAAAAGGALVSTSLLESFGYTVAEALECGLPVAAFDLPALHERNAGPDRLRFADIGNVQELAVAVRGLTGN